MPTHKDLKRLVRARMARTGESYTAARAMVTRKPLTLPAGYEKLTGIRDDAVRAKTGKRWPEWVATLDDIGATEMSHRDIARWMSANHDLGGWWSQMVTVGYERIRGLRAVRQGRSGVFTSTKSRTMPFAEGAIQRAFRITAVRRRWLPDDQVARRGGTRDSKAFRFSCPDGSRGEVRLVPKGRRSTQVTVEHTGLPDAAAAEKRKRYWAERLDALRKVVDSVTD